MVSFNVRRARRLPAAMAAVLLLVTVLTGLSVSAASRGTVANADTSQGQAIVNAAAAESGVTYCWDGGNTSGPTHGDGNGNGEANDCGSPSTVGFDCSGLALYAVYQATGITLPHSSADQFADAATYGGTVVSSQSDLQPGDLVFFHTKTSSTISHVGISAGGNEMWDGNTAWGSYPDGVFERTLSATEGGSGGLVFAGGVRYWNDSGGGAPPPPTIGELDDSGTFYAKSGIGGGWVDEQGDVRAIAIASDPTNGVTVGELDDSGNFFAKSGIGGGWVDELGGVRAIAIASDPSDGVTIGALNDAGTFYAKSGIGGGWVDEQGDVRAIAIASDPTNGVTVGELDDSGNFFAKSGIGGGWVDETGDVRSIAFASDPTYGVTIGELDDSGSFYAKSGIGGGWVAEQGDVNAMSTGGVSSARVPDAPGTGKATSGNRSAMISFTPPTYDGGSPVASYTVTAIPGGERASGSGSPIVVSGLTDGVSYTFTVTADNGLGSSPPSPASNSAVPEAPTTGKVVVSARRGGLPVSRRWICLASHKSTTVTNHHTNAGACQKTRIGEATLTRMKPGTWHLLSIRNGVRRLSRKTVTVKAGTTVRTTWNM
jgi:cell wall-associated NlpC family hydrolase